MPNLTHHTPSPHERDRLATQERQAESDRRAAQRERHTVYDTSLNPLRKTAQEHSQRAAAIGRELAAVIDKIDELTIAKTQLIEDLRKERALEEEASRELTDAIR